MPHQAYREVADSHTKRIPQGSEMWATGAATEIAQMVGVNKKWRGQARRCCAGAGAREDECILFLASQFKS